MHPALADFLAHRGNPLGVLRAAPPSVEGRLLEASLLLCSRDVRDFRKAGALYQDLRESGLAGREARHLRAIGAAAEGDYAGACAIYDEILAAEPCDALALAVAQVFDYYLGNPGAQLGRTTRALRHWNAGMPGYHAVLSLHAYAAQECGDYEAAETHAQRAVALNPWDVRAHHAIAHVMEMQGRFEEGIRWMGSRSALWRGAGASSTHLWWHIALFNLELGRPAQALAVYDHRLQGGALSELIDASALLWRLHLGGTDMAARARLLAARWAPHAEDAHCAFNDVHAMMAFAAAGREDCMRRLLAALERRAANPGGTNHDMTRLVGLPACRALAAFGRSEFTEAERLLRALPPVAHRIGGSHAQRDVLHLTRAVAAARKAKTWLRYAA